MSETGFQLERVQTGPQSYELRLSGEVGFRDAPALWAQLRDPVERGRESVHFDLAGVTRLDSAAAALLSQARADLRRRNVTSEFLHATGSVQEIIELLGGARAPVRTRRRARGVLEQVGRSSERLLHELRDFLAFVGEFAFASGSTLRRPRGANWRELWPLMERAGADAIPIVLLVGFLVGLVSAAQAAAQLERYGANIFVADLVGLSMMRELGPLMTAIVASGRSGAAYAAELGSMKVNEEIDALRVMGLSPIPFLALPRMAALVLVMPLLVLWVDAVGMLGGLVIAVTRLDLSAAAYLNRLSDVLLVSDLTMGFAKSALFALAIGAIACQQGFAARGDASSVGQRTTTAVVGSLFALILIDAAFAVIVGATGQ